MAQEKFGGAHTERKLETLTHYLDAYTTALKNRHFETIYVDAFAGTGAILVGKDESLPLAPDANFAPLIQGSAARALELKTPFDRYVFVERNPAKLQELEQLSERHPHLADRMSFEQNDANRAVFKLCRSENWQRSRAVVFLDPYGNQVEWSTVEAIAGTRAIDLWYLFPAGLGVFRQISSKGVVLPEHANSLDRLLGTADWRTSFIGSQTTPDLFDKARTTSIKQADVDSITRFMIERLRTVFKGVVLDKWLPLGDRGYFMYSLLFASTNPSEKAKELCRKLALAVLK
jgi:three-Cys-motif partner protein